MNVRDSLIAQGVDSGIAEEIARMTPEQREAEADRIRIELGEEKTKVEAERTVNKIQGAIQQPGQLPLTFEQQNALRMMIANGAEPTKAESFLRQNPDYIVGDEFVATQLVTSQRLKPDKVYHQQAEAKAVKDAVGQFLTDNPAFNDKLPFALKQEIITAMNNSNSLELALWERDSRLREFSEKVASDLAETLRNQLRHLHCSPGLEAQLVYELSTIAEADASDVHNLILRARHAQKHAHGGDR